MSRFRILRTIAECGSCSILTPCSGFFKAMRGCPLAQRQTIENVDHLAFVSIVSLWEISIKTSLGKLRLSEPFGEFFDRELPQNAFEILPVNYAHILRLTTLPPHHRDPFDRMLVAQAMQDDLVMVSADKQLDAYGINRIWG